MEQDHRHLLLTTTEAAAARGVSYYQVVRAIHNGRLPAQRAGRIMLIARADLERWQPDHRPPGHAVPAPTRRARAGVSTTSPSAPVAPVAPPPAAVCPDRERHSEACGSPQAFLEQLIAAAPVGIAVVEGPDHRFCLANEKNRSYKHQWDLIGRTFQEVSPSLEGLAAVEMLGRARATGEVMSGSDFLMPGRDGEQRYYSYVIQPVAGQDRLLLIVWETTPQVATRRFLAEQTALLEATLASIPDGVMITDAQGHLLYANATVEGIMGPVPMQAADRAAQWDIRDSDGHPVPLDQMPAFRVLRGESVRAMLLRARTPQGEEKWASVSAAPIRLPNGNVRGVVAVLRDVTEDEERKHALARERERLRAILESSPVGILMVDAADMVIRQCNPTTDAMLGSPHFPPHTLAECMAAQHVWLPNGEQCPYDALPLVRALRGETCFGIEIDIAQPDGRRVPVLVNSAPLRDEHGAIVGAVAAVQNIARLKEIEHEREVFISIATHELRSPLTAILGQAQLLHRRAQRTQSADLPAITTVVEQAKRLQRLIDELLDLSRLHLERLELQREPTDLTALAQKVVQQAAATAPGYVIRLEAPGPVTGTWDAFRLEQVLTNLVSNAVKYSPQGGTITVAIRVRADWCSSVDPCAVEITITD